MGVEEIKSLIIPILKRYGVKKASLFGSFVRGENTERSDIDILVEFEGEKKSARSFKFKNRFRRGFR